MEKTTQVYFPGMESPDDNFKAIITGQRSVPFYVDIDLTTARSSSAGTALTVPIVGNSLYADVNTADGACTLHFQDTSFGTSSVPFSVGPGFIAKIPFSTVLLENTAQPGKKIRLIYGVDIEFLPSVNSSVTISGTVTASISGVATVQENLIAYTGAYSKFDPVAISNQAELIVAAAANTFGITIHSAEIEVTDSLKVNGSFLAKSGAAPTSVVDGDVILFARSSLSATPQPNVVQTELKVKIPAGKGLYFNASSNANNIYRTIIYTVHTS